MKKIQIAKAILKLDNYPDIYEWTCGGTDARRRIIKHKCDIVKGHNFIYGKNFRQELGETFWDFYKFETMNRLGMRYGTLVYQDQFNGN